jgi:hypothetical protein
MAARAARSGHSTLCGDRDTLGVSDREAVTGDDAGGEMNLRLDPLIEALERAVARDGTSRQTDKPQGTAAGPTGAEAIR